MGNCNGKIVDEKVILGVSISVLAIIAKYLISSFLSYQKNSRESFVKHLCPGKVDEESTRNGGELVAEVLKSHGVEFVYTLVGGHVSPILVASEKLGIKVIDTRHEVSAVFAADATARLSGKVGVACVTAGPGVTNTITAVKNAQMAESPILIIGGAAATLAKGRGALQDIEQIGLFKSVCKKSYTIKSVRSIPQTLREACQIALSGTPGPVFVEMPIDVLYPYKLIAQESVLKDPKSIMQWITSKYINHHLRYVFGGAFEKQPTDPLPISIPKASAADISQSVELIKKAKKPIIIVGSQATISPIPLDQVAQSLNDLGIPVFLGGMARGLLGANSSIQMRHKRKEALKDADLVILAGAICDFRLSYGRSLPKKGKIISVNRDKEKMLLNSKQFWTPSLTSQSDVGYFLTQVASQLKGSYQCDSSWVQTLRAREDVREKELVEKASQATNANLNPIKVLQTFDKILPDNAILVADGGDFVGSAAYILRPRKPLSWLDPGPFGTLGVGGGFALGAKLCRPDCSVWVIYGDGSLGYSVMEYDSFIRHKAPVMSIVGNDAGWTQIAREQVPMLGSSVACNLAFSDYHIIPTAFGGKGVKVDRSNEGQLEKILQDTQEANRKGESVLVNVLIGRTDFRDGSISV